MPTIEEVAKDLKRRDDLAARRALNERAAEEIARQEAAERREAEAAELKIEIVELSADLEAAYHDAGAAFKTYADARKSLGELRATYDRRWQRALSLNVAPPRVPTMGGRAAMADGRAERELLANSRFTQGAW